MNTYRPDMSNDAVAEDLKAQSTQPISEEIARLSQQLNTDIRENLPPQLLAVVVGVLQLIEGIEEDTHEGN